MNSEVLEYVKGQRVCVLAVEMLDGQPHASALHFANSNDPLVFIFETDRTYRKSEFLLGRGVTRASVVVGSSETDMKTLQLDGEVKLLTDSTLKELYLEKFPKKRKSPQEDNVIFFTFTPTWWRFTDWTKPEGKTIFTSDGKVVVVSKN